MQGDKPRAARVEDGEAPRVALLDDGELDDVRGLLRDLRVAYCHARHAAVGELVPLLFSTPGQARALLAGQAEAPPRQLHVVIGEPGDDPIGPGLLQLARPIDLAVLRLLTRRQPLGWARDQRLATRVSLGLPVKVRIGDDRREVIVANLSIGGCGLVSPARLREGSTVEISLAAEIDARPDLVLTGVVRTCHALTTSDGQTWDASIAFDPLDMVDRVTLRAMMARHAIDFRPNPGASGRVERSLRERILLGRVERRANARRRFHQRVMGVHDGIAQVMMARDLSREGLRVDPTGRLALGDAVALAIFGAKNAAPLLASATVAREDEFDGSFLRFVGLDPDATRRIEELIDTLVPIDIDATDA